MMDSKPNTVEVIEGGRHEPVVDASAMLQAYINRQNSLTRREAIKEHSKAILWCFYMFFTCIMFGFDSLAGGVVVSIVEFRKDFGHPYAGDYVVDANWQLGFQAATLFGMFRMNLRSIGPCSSPARHNLRWSCHRFRREQIRSSDVHPGRIYHQ